jgi:hypothetical protein
MEEGAEIKTVKIDGEITAKGTNSQIFSDEKTKTRFI